MPAIIDLPFSALSESLPAGSLVILPAQAFVAATGTTPEQPAKPARVAIDVSAVTNNLVDALSDQGVVKALYLLLDAGANAQAVANQSQAVGERLNAFGTATNGPVTNGFVSTTRAMTVRSELASATRITGAIA